MNSLSRHFVYIYIYYQKYLYYINSFTNLTKNLLRFYYFPGTVLRTKFSTQTPLRNLKPSNRFFYLMFSSPDKNNELCLEKDGVNKLYVYKYIMKENTHYKANVSIPE